MIDASWEGGSIMVWQKVFNVFSVVSVRNAHQDEKGCNINLIWIYPLRQTIMIRGERSSFQPSVSKCCQIVSE